MIKYRPIKEDLAELFGYSEEDIVKYTQREFFTNRIREEWASLNPKTQEDLYKFYAKSEGVFWEGVASIGYNADGSELVEPFKRVAEEYKNRCNTVLDYGCGIPTYGLTFHNLGYEVTLADVPGKMFDLIKYRMVKQERRDIKFVDITQKYPLKESYDITICQDVLEHVKDPVDVLKHLYAHTNKLILMEVYFDWGGGMVPQHLHENYLRYNDPDVWAKIVKDIGLKCIWWDQNGVPKLFIKESER